MRDRPTTPIAVSIIIPTLNEAKNLPATLQSIGIGQSGAIPEDMELIVVDGGSTDETCKVAAAFGCRILHQSGGRGAQLAAGGANARGQFFWFVHADTTVPPTWRNLLLDRRLQVAAFRLAINGQHPGLRIVELGVRLRNALENGVPYGDQTLWVSADLYNRVGGFRPVPLFEDVILTKHIQQFTGSIPILPYKVCTNAKRWQKEGIGKRTLRNWRLRLLFNRGVSPYQLAKDYYPE